jgi:pantoate--beta-alanine ligase
LNIARSIGEVRSAVDAARAEGLRIALVPTMGFLHEGHLSLVDLARNHGAGFIVTSIFVNPLQFGPGEDFNRYPRDEARDSALLEDRGVDLLFLPESQTLLPRGTATTVHVDGVALPLEGERRPSHFDGVATIVLKLFHIVRPDFAVFGQKDAQQCAVIQQMVRDLDIPVQIEIGETRREPDGLALSSRNAYLSADERRVAVALSRALAAGRSALEQGVHEAAVVERAMRDVAISYGEIEIDYLRLVDPLTFEGPADFDRELLLVGALRVGATRLIDNIPIPIPAREDLHPAAIATERTNP